MTTNAPVAGWYVDPSNAQQLRWWDGAIWTDRVQAMSAAVISHTELQPVAKSRRRMPAWAWVVIALISVLVVVLLSPIMVPLFLIVLITGIVAVAKNTRTWLRFRSRKAAAVVTAISTVGLLVTGSLSAYAISIPVAPVASPTHAAAPTASEPAPTPTPTPTDTDDDLPAFAGISSTVGDNSTTSDRTALEVLATLPVKGRAAKTGYSRAQFGQRWLDVDRNGCDTRNDILAAQLTTITRRGTCTVLTGVLDDPYTGKTIDFQRGQDTSALVQIDHVVALSDAWQKGAQALTPDQRATFANDPINLLAVDGASNSAKRDGDAATWLPRNKSFRCAYVARQVAVKATYALWVTQAEHDAIERILTGCPDQTVPTSTFASAAPEPTPTPDAPAPVQSAAPVPLVPVPVPVKPAPAKPAPAKPAPVKPAPAKPAPVKPAPPSNVTYKNCADVRAHGAAPLHAGQPGYSRKLDRDGDGIACE